MTPTRSGSGRLATYFHVHLVSDSTGETLNAMAKAVTALGRGPLTSGGPAGAEAVS